METPLEIYELPHWDFRLERTEGKYYNYIYKIIYLARKLPTLGYRVQSNAIVQRRFPLAFVP